MYEVKDKNGDVVGTIDMEGLIKQVYVQDNNNASTPAVYNLDYGYNTISTGYFEDKPDAEDYPFKNFTYAEMSLARGTAAS